MLAGRVNRDQQAFVPLVVRNQLDQSITINALADTGFSGFLTLSANAIGSLNLPQEGIAPATLADGSQRIFRVYRGEVEFCGRSTVSRIYASDGIPLAGMSLFRGCELRIQVIPDGEVSIEFLR